jgi:hypothetical protein
VLVHRVKQSSIKSPVPDQLETRIELRETV